MSWSMDAVVRTTRGASYKRHTVEWKCVRGGRRLLMMVPALLLADDRRST
jgi:hypothetical protein